MSKPPVLVVDDDSELRDYVARALKVEGYPVEAFGEGGAVLQRLDQSAAAVVVADVFLTGLNGIELLKRVVEGFPGTEVVLTGRDVPTATIVSAMRLGAADFVEKPLDVDHLLLCVGRAVDRGRLAFENQALKRVMGLTAGGEIVAASPRTIQVLEQVDLVAGSDIRVLVEGESGVGKELVAQRIHRNSPRHDKPFVAVNCGAIQESLLESELFGHKKGAFTGATTDHRGLFEVADRGTLFLDEIGEMPVALQVKLLRALQERVVMKVGDSKQEKVDIRVLAATNRNLEEEIQKGGFREDLYYRLNVVNLHLPPLRERGDDVVVLAKFLLQKYAREYGAKVKGFTPGALAAMKKYDWPGNVRQLENRIKKAVVLADKTLVGPEDMDLFPEALAPVVPLSQAREEFTRRYILEVLERNNGNRTKTARDLGVDPRTIFRYLEREPDAPSPGGG